MHVPVGEHPGVDALDGPRLVPDDEVRGRATGIRGDERVARGHLLRRRPRARVAEPAWVVEPGDADPATVTSV